MDISTKAVSATGRLHLRDADEELLYDGDKEVAVNVYGPGSKQYAKAQAAQQNRAMNMLKSKGKVDQSAEQRRQENAEFLADCTESFENLEYKGLGLTGRALAVAVYSDIGIGFIADQVAKHIGDWSNFSKPAATN